MTEPTPHIPPSAPSSPSFFAEHRFALVEAAAVATLAVALLIALALHLVLARYRRDTTSGTFADLDETEISERVEHKSSSGSLALGSTKPPNITR